MDFFVNESSAFASDLTANIVGAKVGDGLNKELNPFRTLSPSISNFVEGILNTGIEIGENKLGSSLNPVDTEINNDEDKNP